MSSFYGKVDISQQIEQNRTRIIGTFDPKVLKDWIKDLKADTTNPVELIMIESEYPYHALAAREVGVKGDYNCVCPVIITEEPETA